VPRKLLYASTPPGHTPFASPSYPLALPDAPLSLAPGTNYLLTVKAGGKEYEAKVWGELEGGQSLWLCHGGVCQHTGGLLAVHLRN